MKKTLLTISMMLMCSLAFAGTTQISPVSNSNQTVVVNDNFDSLQGGLNSLQGTFSGYFTNGVLNAANGGTGGTSGGFPSGGIIMWSGSIATIPSGWELCNGSCSKITCPDLRNRFIVGAVADVSGVAKTTVTDTATPTYTQSGDGQIPAHTHTDVDIVGSAYGYNQQGEGWVEVKIVQASNTGSFGTGTKNVATYWALAYIIKD